MHRYKSLEIWKRSIKFATKIYETTAQFPPEEKYGLISQLRRCVVSISSNIAEGAGRNTNKSFKYFLSMAYGSTCELETQIIISKNMDYISSSKSKKFCAEIDELQKMIFSFSKTLKGK